MKYNGISKNSKLIKPGFIYCCFEGEKSGYDYIQDALDNGATKIIGEKNIQIDKYEIVEDVNKAMTKYAQEIYLYESNKSKKIGVTGTDGKTSTALLIDNILNKLSSSSYLGTNGFFINQKEIEYDGFTTPYADKLYEYLKKSNDKKSGNFVMEVSSHALEQKRIFGIDYDVCIFTNLGEEHLDFHKTVDNYYTAKKKLFKQLKNKENSIINYDDKYGKMIYSEMKKGLRVGQDKDCEFKIQNIDVSLEGTTYELVVNCKTYTINSPLLAEFNVYNLTQAIAAVYCLGYKIEEVLNLIEDIKIPGRLELVKSKNSPKIIIDFAHTKEAIEKVMDFIKPLQKEGKIYTLTGSAGKRDQIKRPGMGKAVTDKSDYVVFTEDDPRNEDVMNIISDLKSGITNKKCEVHIIEDRKKAIEFIIKKANSLDTIILFGKGSMKTMYYDGYEKTYSELEEVMKNVRLND